MRLLDPTRLVSILLVIAAGPAFAAEPPAPDTPEARLAARAAVGMQSLPNDIPVEVEAVFEIVP